MKKTSFVSLLAMLALAVTLTCCNGCKTVESTSTAVWVGCTSYEAYQRIADNQTPEVRAKAEALWQQIDQVEDVMSITNVYKAIADMVDDLIKTNAINPKQATALKVLRTVFDNIVTVSLSQDNAKKSKAIIWIKKWREGVRLMIKLDGGEDVAAPCVGFDCCTDCTP